MDMPTIQPSKQKLSLRQDQKGFASIVIALIMIVVLALITVGFAQLARREQQSALDKQLATQAYYASESGINDTQQLIQKVIANPGGIPGLLPSLNSLTPPSAGLGGSEDPDKCLDQQGFPGIANGSISNGTGVSYSCVLLNLTPPNMVWSGVSPDADRSTTFSTTGSLGSFTVFWSSHDNNTTPQPGLTADNEFAPSASWVSGNHPAVLEVSLTPLNDLSRNGMIANTFNVFLYPSAGTGGNVTYDTTSQGQVQGNACSATTCKVTINGINGGSGDQFLVHIMDYYDQSDITVGNARDKVTGTQIDFVNGQAVIDSTGKARTVLKRLQVYAPIVPAAPLPPYALEGQNVCKRFDTVPSPGTTTPDTTLPGCDLN
jgi:type II secretory pathway pseudopilin PulG